MKINNLFETCSLALKNNQYNVCRGFLGSHHNFLKQGEFFAGMDLDISFKYASELNDCNFSRACDRNNLRLWMNFLYEISKKNNLLDSQIPSEFLM